MYSPRHNSDDRSKPQGLLYYLKDYILIAIFAFIFALVIRTLVVQPFLIDKVSMTPNLLRGDYVLINKLVYRFKEPELGDVAIFRSPRDNSYLVKRVVAKGGDHIIMTEDGHIILNGEEVIESYANYGSYDSVTVDTVVPQGQYFMVGDNRSNSLDSRWFGSVERKMILGKAFVILLPFSRMGMIENDLQLQD
jgi:signal peptidase I